MTLDTLLDEARDLHDETVALRRTCTVGPSSAIDLPSRRERCSRRSTGCRSTSRCTRRHRCIAALLTGGKPGPTVLLRGDMDALPLHEDTGLDFASTRRRHDARLRSRHAHRDAGRRRASC